jgi:hypothetical protein
MITLIGALCMIGAFFVRGVRGAFSGGPWLPVTTAQRVIIFIFGVLVLIGGLRSLLQ